MKFDTPVKQLQPFNYDYFLDTIDARFMILWDFEFFEKIPCGGSSNFRKI